MAIGEIVPETEKERGRNKARSQVNFLPYQVLSTVHPIDLLPESTRRRTKDYKKGRSGNCPSRQRTLGVIGDKTSPGSARSSKEFEDIKGYDDITRRKHSHGKPDIFNPASVLDEFHLSQNSSVRGGGIKTHKTKKLKSVLIALLLSMFLIASRIKLANREQNVRKRRFDCQTRNRELWKGS